MPILKEKKTWKRRRASHQKQPGELSSEEQVYVKAALRALRVRFGTYGNMARSMGISSHVLARAASLRWPINAALAFEVARLAQVPVDDVLSGSFPNPNSCPLCSGRIG